MLSYLSFRRVYDESGEMLTDIELEPGVPFRDDRDNRGSLMGETTEYPQYAITFTVD